MFSLTQLSKVLAPVSFTILSFAQGANAMWIESGFYDSQAKSIVLDVKYGGGCKDHPFKLSLGICGDSFPTTCQAALTDEGEPDPCRGMQYEKLTYTLVELGLDAKKFEGATINIEGPATSIEGIEGVKNLVVVTLKERNNLDITLENLKDKKFITCFTFAPGGNEIIELSHGDQGTYCSRGSGEYDKTCSQLPPERQFAVESIERNTKVFGDKDVAFLKFQFAGKSEPLIIYAPEVPTLRDGNKWQWHRAEFRSAEIKDPFLAIDEFDPTGPYACRFQ